MYDRMVPAWIDGTSPVRRHVLDGLTKAVSLLTHIYCLISFFELIGFRTLFLKGDRNMRLRR